MTTRLTTDEQLESIWSRCDNGDMGDLRYGATRTVDLWGEPMTIFETWEDVEFVGEIAWAILPAEVLELAPSFEHSKYPVNKYHHIEWAIGDYGFSDQWQTCSHCYTAIDTTDTWPQFYFNGDMGDLVCAQCIGREPSFADEYLLYCAKHYTDGEIARNSFCSPLDHGYVCVNAYSVSGGYSHTYDLYCTELGVTELNDIPQWHGLLDTANHNDLARLHKASQIIDPELIILPQYSKFYGSTYLYWVKFDESKELPEGEHTQRAILDYAMGLVLAKWHKLTLKDNGYSR